MFASRPVVHPDPVEVELAADAAAAPPPEQQPEQPQQPHGVLMKDLPGTPGTPVALGLRVAQLFFAGVALSVMASTGDFMTVTAFCIFVAAIIFQCVWSLSMAIVDLYALLVKRCLRNRRAVSVFAVGDLITAGITLGAACGSAGITVLIDDDLYMCSENHCASFESANAMAFMCWFASAPCVILNLRSMASGDRI